MFGSARRKDISAQSAAPRPPAAPPQTTSKRPLTRRVMRYTFLIGLPIVLLPALLPRKVSAKRLTGAHASLPSRDAESLTARQRTIQDLVEDIKARLTIPNPVLVSIVPENKLVVSVERLKDSHDSFTMLMQADFLEGLSDEELQAVVAHELGHVWIFTHHPFLQTEELANEIALRVVQRDILEGVYAKVWKRTGTKGSLVYLPVE
jgi:hypothetical protein